MKNASPLRYPGGKWRFGAFFERLLLLNFDQPPFYIEPYCGGASLALSLLFSGAVREIQLNDLDPAIYAFWFAALKHTRALIHLIENVEITPAEWQRQKGIYADGPSVGRLRLGFATFFLNRTNHSGILNGGMIGGKKQSGQWKLDARFNRSALISRIERIAAHGGRIHISNIDATTLIRKRSQTKSTFFYLDPPYFAPGQRLYMNAYRPEDHVRVRNCVCKLHCKWVVSYDDVGQIRTLYRRQRSRNVRLLHTARSARPGKEVMFFCAGLRIPTLHP